MPTFEWDPPRPHPTSSRHGITFETATLAFRDPFAIEWIDTRHHYGEERVILLALAANIILYVAYTERADTIRLISARRAPAMSKTNTTAATPPSAPRPMTEAQIEAAARADPDAQPLTEADMATMPRIPRAKTLRRGPRPDPRRIRHPLPNPPRHPPRLGTRPRRTRSTRPRLPQGNAGAPLAVAQALHAVHSTLA